MPDDCFEVTLPDELTDEPTYTVTVSYDEVKSVGESSA